VLAEAEIEMMYGDLDRSRAALDRAHRTWPDRPEVLLVESQFAVLAGDFDRALDLSSRACELDPLPWTWRRAKAHSLQLRVQRIDMNDPPPGDLESIRTEASALRDRARAAFDRQLEARAEQILAYTNPDPFDFVVGLERVLELEPGDPSAGAQFIEQVHGLWAAGVPLQDLPRERAERVIVVAEGLVARHAVEPRCLTREQLLASALRGARMATVLDERDRAVQLGATVHDWLQSAPDERVRAELDALRGELGVERWR
jgi:hypothetical protein